MHLWRELSDEEAASYREFAHEQWAEWTAKSKHPVVNRMWHPVVRLELALLIRAQAEADMADMGSGLLQPLVDDMERAHKDDPGDPLAKLAHQLIHGDKGGD